MPTVESPGQDHGAMGAPPVLVPGARRRRVFPGEERQLGILRRWLASLLPECPARDDLVVVADELCSNAIRHTPSGRGGEFAVEVIWLGAVVRVAVADNGGLGEPQVIEDLAAEHGRGLLLVRGLSARTGVSGDHRGRTVWADVRWDGPAPVAVAGTNEAAIRAGEAALARQFAGVPVWFGRSTLQWWALSASDGLISAPSARELATLLRRLDTGRAAVRSNQPTGGLRRGPELGGPFRRADAGGRPRTQGHRDGGERPDGYSHVNPRRIPRSERAPARRPAVIPSASPAGGAA